MPASLPPAATVEPPTTPALTGPDLAAMRRARGLTQRRLADIMGRSPARIGQIEDGRPLEPATIAGYLAGLDGNPAPPWQHLHRGEEHVHGDDGQRP